MGKSTNLQVYMEPDLRKNGEMAAKEYGFSSLQEMVRFMIVGVSKGRFEPVFVQKSEKLSPIAERRYMKEIAEFEELEKQGKTPKPVYSGEELIKQLESEI